MFLPNSPYKATRPPASLQTKAWSFLSAKIILCRQIGKMAQAMKDGGAAKLCYAGTEVASAMALTIAGASLQPRMYFLPSLKVTGKQSEALP